MTLDLHKLLERAGLAGLQSLAIDRIDTDPQNPRRVFDEVELTALATSIRERGLLQPIAVFPANDAGRYQLRFGERRLRAARIAGLATIMAIVGEPDSGSHILDQVVENDQREGLSALEIAEAIGMLITSGMTKAQIGAQLGRPAPTVSLYVALLSMPPHLRDLSNIISLRTLNDLYRLWRHDQATVDAFVARTPSDEITRGEVGKLLRRVDAARSARAARGNSGQTTREGEGPGHQAPGRVGGSNRPIVDIGRVRVVSEGREGWLLYPARARPGRLLVRFDGDSAPCDVNVDGVSILEALPQ